MDLSYKKWVKSALGIFGPLVIGAALVPVIITYLPEKIWHGPLIGLGIVIALAEIWGIAQLPRWLK